MNVENILIPNTYNNDIDNDGNPPLIYLHKNMQCKISISNSVATKCFRGGVRRADALYSRIFKTTTHKKATVGLTLLKPFFIFLKI